jgi:hypothetical protein
MANKPKTVEDYARTGAERIVDLAKKQTKFKVNRVKKNKEHAKVSHDPITGTYLPNNKSPGTLPKIIRVLSTPDIEATRALLLQAVPICVDAMVQILKDPKSSNSTKTAVADLIIKYSMPRVDESQGGNKEIKDLVASIKAESPQISPREMLGELAASPREGDVAIYKEDSYAPTGRPKTKPPVDE